MKIGMMFECARGGPDIKVCEAFARALMPRCVIEPVAMDTKKKLRTECGSRTLALLESGCDRVIIVWDLYPAWGEDADEEPLMCQDINMITVSLVDAAVSRNRVDLVCIDAMLETWLLSDEQALKWVAEAKRRRELSSFSKGRINKREKDPKGVLERLFQKHGCPIYTDHTDASRIATYITAADRWDANMRRLLKNKSFKRFAERLTGRSYG